MSAQTFPVAIWQPTDEALAELEHQVTELRAVFTQREDYVKHVETQTALHIQPLVLLNDLLNQDLFNILNPNANTEDEVIEGNEDEDLYEYDSLEEERQSKGLSRAAFKKISEIYKRIQRLCHPDKTPHKQLHELSVRASLLAEQGSLTELLVLYSHAKLLKSKLDKYSEALASSVHKYLELENERDAYEERLSDLQPQYESAMTFAENREAFLDAAFELTLEDIEETLRVYKSHDVEIPKDLVKRINEFDFNLIDRVYAEKVNPSPIFSADPISSLFGDTEVFSDPNDMMRKLFPDED